jgi:hypothetical protein
LHVTSLARSKVAMLWAIGDPTRTAGSLASWWTCFNTLTASGWDGQRKPINLNFRKFVCMSPTGENDCGGR